MIDLHMLGGFAILSLEVDELPDTCVATPNRIAGVASDTSIAVEVAI